MSRRNKNFKFASIGLDFGTSLGIILLLTLSVEQDACVECMLSTSPLSHEKTQALVTWLVEEHKEKLLGTHHKK